MNRPTRAARSGRFSAPTVAVAAAFLMLVLPLNTSAQSDPTAARIAVLKDAFHYDATLHAKLAAESEAEPVFVLEKMTITESISRRMLAKDIANRWAEEKTAQFAWDKGGEIGKKMIGPVEVHYGFWPELIDRTVGAQPTREIMLSIDLLRMRW